MRCQKHRHLVLAEIAFGTEQAIYNVALSRPIEATEYVVAKGYPSPRVDKPGQCLQTNQP